MSETPKKKSEAEEKFLLAVGSITLFVVLPIMWLFDLGPFGWFDGGGVSTRESEYLVGKSGFACITENAALRLEDATARRDSGKLKVLMDSQCINTVPTLVPLKFNSGSFSTSVRYVSWPATQGHPAGSGYIGPSYFEYMTDAELDKAWETWGPICEKYSPGDCATGR